MAGGVTAVAPTLAVTVAVWKVVGQPAFPPWSVVAKVVFSVPALVENETGVETSGLPFTSSTEALIVAEPPYRGHRLRRRIDDDPADGCCADQNFQRAG